MARERARVPHQAGTGGVGHGIHIFGFHSRIRQHLFHQGQSFAYVVPRGELGDYAAILPVHRNLALRVARQAPHRFCRAGYNALIPQGIHYSAEAQLGRAGRHSGSSGSAGQGFTSLLGPFITAATLTNLPGIGK